MYDAVITLKAGPVIGHDDYGNEVVSYTDSEVFAMPRGIYKSEFYSAAQVGLHPSITFRLTNPEDYEGQKFLEYDGKAYAVVRVDWTAQRDTIDLICEERVGDDPIPQPQLEFFDMTDYQNSPIMTNEGDPIQAGVMVNRP